MQNTFEEVHSAQGPWARSEELPAEVADRLVGLQYGSHACQEGEVALKMCLEALEHIKILNRKNGVAPAIINDGAALAERIAEPIKSLVSAEITRLRRFGGRMRKPKQQ